jgi:diguanylate cyclase (GGDEF)-like protein
MKTSKSQGYLDRHPSPTRTPTAYGSDSAAGSNRLRQLEHENQRLQLTVRRLRQLAYVDGLTGLANRRHFDEVLASEILRACRAREPLALVICDVDYFKSINDTLGHFAGDEVLRTLSRIFDSACRRGGDLAARYGGDEFVAIMPGVNAFEIQNVAENLRRAVANLAIPCGRPPQSIYLTISIGATTFRSTKACPAFSLIRAADTALYRAKNAGRNTVRYQDLTRCESHQ